MTYARTWAQTFGSRSRPGRAIGRVSGRVLHHEAGAPLPASASLSQEVARVRAIDAYHRSLKWAGFGYSAMVALSGRIHEGRGYFRSGAHTRGLNSSALAVVVPGNNPSLPDRAIEAIRAWDRAGIAAGALTTGGRWTGHRDHGSTSCPGDRPYSKISELNRSTTTPTPSPTPQPPEETPMLLTKIDGKNAVYAVRKEVGATLLVPISRPEMEAYSRIIDGRSWDGSRHVGNLTSDQVREAGFVVLG